MKLYRPPKIIYHIQGYVSEAEQKKIRAEAQRQVGLLRDGMAFQGLSQGRRRGVAGGLEFRCTSVFGLESVAVGMAGGEVFGEREKIKPCWCTCQFSAGTIRTEIPGSVDPTACKPAIGGIYPACAINDIGDFDGLRYDVGVCHYSKGSGKSGHRVSYICIPTDFEIYLPGDAVIVLYISENGDCGLDCLACGATGRDKSADTIVEGLDGQFVILPYTVL